MSSDKELKKVVKDNLSHPSDVIRYHITTGVCLAFLLAVLFFLYVFFTSIKDDPLLYTQMSMGNEFVLTYNILIRKEKYN